MTPSSCAARFFTPPRALQRFLDERGLVGREQRVEVHALGRDARRLRAARRGGARSAGRHSSVIRFVRASATARSTMFSSSRTLPGKRVASSAGSTAGSSSRTSLAELARVLLRRSAATSSGMSSRPLAQRRQLDLDHVQPVVEVLAEAALAHLLVEPAVGRRTGCARRRGSRWCRRRAGTCGPGSRAAASPGAPSASSPISSRNSVPPFATSNRPGLLALAPVNAPFTWPNSSLSSRFSGIAPQLTATNGASRRSRQVVDRARDELLAGAALAA